MKLHHSITIPPMCEGNIFEEERSEALSLFHRAPASQASGSAAPHARLPWVSHRKHNLSDYGVEGAWEGVRVGGQLLVGRGAAVVNVGYIYFPTPGAGFHPCW